MSMAQAQIGMRVRTIRTSAYVLVKVLLQHPMHSGMAKDERGNLPPAHYITRITLHIDGVLRVQADIGPGVARNPLFGWRLRDVAAGAEVVVAWQDNQGLSGSQTVAAA